MGFVRSFDGFTPPSLFSGEGPFTEVDVQEAENVSGPWTTIDTIELTPADTDPANPQARDLTTTNATLDPYAWYRLVWKDSSANVFNSDPIEFDDRPSALADVTDVLRVLRIDSVSDDDEERINAALQTASEWAKRYLRAPHLGESGSVTESFFGDTVVPYEGTITSVVGIPYPGSEEVEIPSDQYQANGTHLRILAANWVWPGLPADERNVSARLRDWEIQVTTTREAPISATERDGIALAAAALWYRSPRLGKGLTGETIGGYSYTVAQLQSGDPYYEQAKSLLRPLIRRTDLVP